LRARSWSLLCASVLACSNVQAAAAADCPGHPDAIGTSRTIVVDPREHPRIGTMQYPETLPLRDHEVVLTFDDGPLPRYSNQVLQILADQCVKAVFFEIGKQAQESPEGVRKLAAAGHTIGTHSQTHPLTFQKMPVEKARQEIDDGIASVSAALEDPSVLAPFFRIPGLLRAEGVEDYLASRGIQVWSADFPADDWHHISSMRVFQTAMKRLEAKGKGILLLHDIHERTVAALPRLLRELKVRGFHIVEVVPATPTRPATPTEPQEWRQHPDAVPTARWQAVPSFVSAETATLPAPALSDFVAPNGALLLAAEPFERVRVGGKPPETSWPRPAATPTETAVIALPAPAASLFEVPDSVHVALRSLKAAAHRAELAAAPIPAGAIPARRVGHGHGARTRVVHARHPVRHAAHSAAAAPRQPAQAARRTVRVAGLKPNLKKR
jgi:peptidoglycan/xylan/chitin deacetylase (PgdA/CDA1 family)